MEDLTLLTGLLGLILIAAILLRMGAERSGLPPLVGYILLGFLLRWLEASMGVLPTETSSALHFLGTVGVVFLLFGVGLKADLASLKGALGKAGWIWLGNVLVSGGIGYLAARYILGLGVLPALVLGVALTATSVGITVGVWQSKGALETEEGRTLLDVAELDDVSAVILMAVLFAVLPTLQGPDGQETFVIVGKTVGLFIVKGLVFGAFCVILARHVERRITGFLSREGEPSRIIVVSGMGLLLAALAGALGFSVAIGAFFAGIVFSVDPEKIREETSFQALHDFFVPFFFLSLGFKVDPQVLGEAIVPGLVLLAAAVAGKILGTYLPAVRALGSGSALVLGMSMVPRAEISLIVMERALNLDPGIVTHELFGAMVVVSLATAVVFPLLMGWGLDRLEH